MMNRYLNLFDDFADFFDSSPKVEKTPEGDSKVVLDVPGFNKDNLKVELEDGVLTIKGEKPERKYFKQYYVNTRVNDIAASIVDGELTLTLKYPKAEVKQIELS